MKWGFPETRVYQTSAVMALTLSLLLLSVVNGGTILFDEHVGLSAETSPSSKPFLSTLISKSRQKEDDKQRREGKVLSEGQNQRNSLSRPSLASSRFLDGPTKAKSSIQISRPPLVASQEPSYLPSSPSSTPKPSPLQSLSNLVSQGLGVFGGSNIYISISISQYQYLNINI